VERITRTDLIAALAEQLPELSIKEIEQGVKHLFEHMVKSLEKGLRIEIRGFGSFSLRHRPARLARNPKTGEQVKTEGKYAPHFKPGKELRARINGGVDHSGDR
jgi:integration host factor subunit beta